MKARVSGVVDSGADRTLLPIGVATALGIQDELIKTPLGGGGAAETGFDVWRVRRRVEARVVAEFLGGRRLWGPRLWLDPVFAMTDEALFGRADFFAAFTITFWNDDRLGSIFQLKAA